MRVIDDFTNRLSLYANADDPLFKERTHYLTDVRRVKEIEEQLLKKYSKEGEK